jgi:drug/metabolite transporter (DMT)-like permease
MFLGVAALSVDSGSSKPKLSKYALAALAANLLWVTMWILFYYTLPSSYPPSLYFAWVVAAALLFSAFTSHVFRVRRAEFAYAVGSPRRLALIAVAVVSNGVGSAMFAVSYGLRPVATPLLVEMYVPAVMVLGALRLKERVSTREAVGAALIVASLFAYFLV